MKKFFEGLAFVFRMMEAMAEGPESVEVMMAEIERAAS